MIAAATMAGATAIVAGGVATAAGEVAAMAIAAATVIAAAAITVRVMPMAGHIVGAVRAWCAAPRGVGAGRTACVSVAGNRLRQSGSPTLDKG